MASLVLTDKEYSRIREANCEQEKIKRILKNTPYLYKLSLLLEKKVGVRLGETCALMKTCVNPKTNRAITLPDHILDCSPRDWWYCHVFGICQDTKKVIIRRYFRDTSRPYQFKLPSIYFLKPLSETKKLLLEIQNEKM